MHSIRKKTRKVVSFHFRKRCIDRLGQPLGQDALRKELFGKEHGKSIKYHQSNTRTHFELSDEFLEQYGIPTDKKVIVVYDKLRHAFLTVLTHRKYQKLKEPENQQSESI